jgi:hypothetical protein
VKANAHGSASWLEFARNQRPHCYGSGMPAAGGHSTENRAARCHLIEVEGLRVEIF